MRVKLKVTKGASTGKVFEVKVPQFVIGRSRGCQLRPQSDAISRQHCAILINEDSVTIRDLGSRNGTILNGKPTSGEQPLVTGDEIRVGPLHLTVTVTDDQGVVLKPKPQPAKAARVDAAEKVPKTGPSKTSDSGIISDWLVEEEQAGDASLGLTHSETRQFKLDETERIEINKAAEEVAAEPAKKKDKKKEPGKLPKRKEDETANSREAAEKTLRQMFNRGL